MKKKVLAFLRNEEGLTIVEYAVASCLISAAVVVAFTNLGTEVLGVINALITAIGGGGGGVAVPSAMAFSYCPAGP